MSYKYTSEDFIKIVEEANIVNSQAQLIIDENLNNLVEIVNIYDEKFVEYILSTRTILSAPYSKKILDKIAIMVGINYFEIALKQNIVHVYSHLGNIYRIGELVDRDIKKALEYYQIGNKMGCQICCNNLAVIYEFGIFEVKNNCLLSANYYNVLGKIDSAKNVLRSNIHDLKNYPILNVGIVLKKVYDCDLPKEFYPYLEYVNSKLNECQNKMFHTIIKLIFGSLNYLEYNEENTSWNEEYFMKNIDFNNEMFKKYLMISSKYCLNSISILANMFEKGLGVPKDERAAFKLYNLGYIKGGHFCLISLGNMYFYGIGTNQNISMAEFMYQKAHQSEIKEANDRLKMVNEYRKALNCITQNYDSEMLDEDQIMLDTDQYFDIDNSMGYYSNTNMDNFLDFSLSELIQ